MNEYPNYLKSFSRTEYGAHIQKLQQGMGISGIDILLLSSPENVFYTTGYRSWYTPSLFRPVLVFVPRVGEPAVSLRVLEKSTVENISWCPNIYAAGTKSKNLGPPDSEEPADAMKRFLGELEYEVETAGLKVGDGRRYVWSLTILEKLTNTFPHLIFTDGTAAIQGAHTIRTPWGIDRIRTAGWVTEAATMEAFRQIRSGITTEKDTAKGIASGIAARGVGKISYLTVNSGRDKYHTLNSYAVDRIVNHKDIVLADISGHIDGYASNLAKVMYLGRTPSRQYVRMAETARNCVHAGFDMLGPEVEMWGIDQAIGGYLRGSRHGSNMVHSSRHSTGLNVVEYPSISNDYHETVRAGMVFALKNGVYLYDLEREAGTVRISFHMEDEVLMTESGAEWLSEPRKTLYTMGDFC